MAIAQAFFVSSPLSAFANRRHSCSSAESTLRSIHNYVGTWRSYEDRNVGFLPDLRRSECRSSKSSNFVSLNSPEVGLICLTKQSGITSNSPFPFCIRSRESRNYLSKNHDSGIRKPVVRRAAVTTKQEESVVTVEEGGGGGGMGGPNDGGGGGGGGGGDAVDWISSALIFAFWAGLIFYAITLSPNQTSYRDMYFLEKLCNLHGDDGFVMNKVLTGEWFMMGLWPLVYTCLLIPSGRSRKGGVPVGPFAVLSCFIGAGALLPYFGLWRPPPPAVSRDELSRWPLSVLESKITAVVTVVTAVVLLGYAGLAGADQWVEFIQYFRESRFIHIMTIDFFTLSTLCPFWVYNDLSIRKGSDKTSSLWALAFLPLFGPSIYLLLRPSLPASMMVESEKKNDEVSS